MSGKKIELNANELAKNNIFHQARYLDIQSLQDMSDYFLVLKKRKEKENEDRRLEAQREKSTENK